MYVIWYELAIRIEPISNTEWKRKQNEIRKNWNELKLKSNDDQEWISNRQLCYKEQQFHDLVLVYSVTVLCIKTQESPNDEYEKERTWIWLGFILNWCLKECSSIWKFSLKRGVNGALL